LLSPEETKHLYPLMNVDDIYGSLFSPSDETMEPNGLCHGLTRAATKAGAKVRRVYQCSQLLSISMEKFQMDSVKA